VLRRILLVISIALVILIGVVWLGLRIPAPAFASPDAGREPLTPVPIPDGLPAPVERFARAIYGHSLPSAQTAMVMGRADVTMNGVAMPARFRFYYDMNHGHYHDIQVTWFTLPIMAIHERYRDGHAIIDIPIIGRTEDDRYTDAASNQGFWAELIAWVPALALQDPRVRWEAIDETSARMIVPNAPAEEAFTLTFDPATGYLATLTAQRYQGSDGVRHHWQPNALEWRAVDGTPTMARSSISWDDSAPWVVWDIDHVALNVDVSSRLAQFGGEVATQ
jgi:hypothetical protein